MFVSLWNYLRGYVIIRVMGFSVERFVNLAALKGICIWNLRHDDTSLIMSVSLNGFKDLGECAKKTRCRYKIIEKKGLPFMAERSKGRKAYIIGIGVFVTLLYIMSSFIWTIEVKGNDRLSTEQIMQFCGERGLTPGNLKRSVSIEEVTKGLITSFKDISWVAITTKGTQITITVVETIPELQIKDRQTPSNIVADKNCIVESISVSGGTPFVRAGDVVEVGDLLVGGELVIEDMDAEADKKYVRSEAEIFGRSTCTFEKEIELKYIKKVYTGNKKEDKSLLMGKYIVRGISTKLDYEKYDTNIKELKEFKIGDYVLPIKLESVEYAQFYEQEQQRTVDEAKALLYEDISKIKDEYIFNGGKIVKEEVGFLQDNNKLKAQITLTVTENLGKEEPIIK